VPPDLVRKISDHRPPFAETPTVVDPAPPTVDPGTVAAPIAATPTPTPPEG
jgi:hypothetical protein